MIGAVISALVLAAASPTPVPGPVREVGGNYTVPAGQVVNGNVSDTGGSVTVDGTVKGTVEVVDGSVTVNGTVQGNVAVVRGSLTLGPHARVTGDVQLVDSTLTRQPGAIVDGTTTTIGFFGSPPTVNWVARWLPFWNPASNLVIGLLITLCVAALAFGAYLFFPGQVATISNAIWLRPGTSLGLGALTAVTGALLAAVLAVTVILIPLSIAIGVAMAAGWLLGWAGILLLLAKRLVDVLRVGLPPTPAFIVVALLAVVAANVPVLGGLAVLVGGFFALGATVITRFGTRSVPGAGPTF